MVRRFLHRETREDSCRDERTQEQQQSRWPDLFVSIILALALGFRIWGIRFGLPYDLTYDEIHEIVRAFKLGAGEFDWDGITKGGLYYLLFIEYGLMYVIWLGMGWVADTHDFALLFFHNATPFYLAGRLTVAVMGMLTCWIVFCIGKHLYTVQVGIGSALIGATAYFHGHWSHYINVDIGVTLALWASVLSYLRYERSHKPRWLLLSGMLGAAAIAFKLPGAIVMPLILVAIALPAQRPHRSYRVLKEGSLFCCSLLISLTIIAPEIVLSFTMGSSFSSIAAYLFGDVSAPVSTINSFAEQVDAVTIYQDQSWLGYLLILLKPYNIVLTVSSLLGIGLGLWRGHRWDSLWALFSLVFIGVMMTAALAPSERYLLPIMPALWLLSSRAIISLAKDRVGLTIVGFACVILIPLVTLMYDNYMNTQADTRILAKAWIEANVSPGAKILLDGQRYRFIQSPPLSPSPDAVKRRIIQAAGPQRVSRGVSSRTLTLYAEAMDRRTGPRYDLHSTVYGLEVKELDNYIASCSIDYIVTSSANSMHFESKAMAAHFPISVRFYTQLPVDKRFQVVYTSAPKSWQSRGPLISVYKVHHNCL